MKKAGCGSWLFFAFTILALISYCAENWEILVLIGAILFLVWVIWIGCKSIHTVSQNGKVPNVPVDQLTGKEYERYVGEKLRCRGYSLIRYTPESGDYGADIIMKSPAGEKVCIQCKRYKRSVGVSAVQEIVAAKGYYGCTEAIVATTAAFTSSAKELAARNGVQLLEYFK